MAYLLKFLPHPLTHLPIRLLVDLLVYPHLHHQLNSSLSVKTEDKSFLISIVVSAVGDVRVVKYLVSK